MFQKLFALTLAVIFSLTAWTSPAFAYSQSDLDRFLATNQCNGCDLSGADLSGKELYGSALIEANLSQANLSEALFNDAKLRGANLTGADLSDAILMGITLSEADLTGANLSGADLYNALLNDATLSAANLTEANLTSAILSCTESSKPETCTDLSGARGQSANLNKAILSGANLSGADFSQAKMAETNLVSASLQGTLLCNTDLFRAKMPNNTIYNGDVSQFGADASCTVASSLGSGDSGSPKFDPAKVRLGITPTGWSNSDDPSIDLVPPIPGLQILSEMALADFKGTQMSGKFPKDMETLKQELALRNLTISEPWVGTFFTIGATEDSQNIFDQQMAFMKELGGNVIVVAELGGAVHQQPIAPLPNRPIFTDAQWNQLTQGLNDIGKQAHDAGMVLAYHPHVGTGVETPADVDRLMENTNPQYLQLLLDTGHLYYAISEDSSKTPEQIQAEIEALTTKYADRIKHVHLKNIRESVLNTSIERGDSFLNSIREGAFTVPGDSAGIINFEPILNTLASVNYEGWLVVEAEQDPNKANPLQYALMARDYLREVTGL